MPKQQKRLHRVVNALTLNTRIGRANSYEPNSPELYTSSSDEGGIGPRALVPYLPFLEKTMDAKKSPYARTQGFHPAETVKNWLHVCDKQHRNRGGCSVEPSHAMDSPWSRPLLLIDVIKGCLVSTPPDAEYVALSYTWGKSSGASTCTLKENIAGFRKAGGLVASKETLPRTVKDAVEFVKQIGQRYLWVDRFCIVQDETVAKQSQLDAMGRIYAGSYLTIIAAQSDDACGPLYEPSRKQERAQEGSDTEGEGESGTRILLDHTRGLMRSAWNSRAWTFQEYLFSKRKVIFQGGTVNWECGISAWHETQQVSMDTVPELKSEHNHARTSSITRLKGNFAGLDFPAWPDISRYARLVALFNIRQLSFPEDALDAFAGVLSQLSRVFPGGIISGIPAMCFDAALLWQPYRPMNRRTPIKASASEAVLPSWSWAGWAGNLNSESWRSAANYLFEGDETYLSPQTTWKTTSTVEWSYSIRLDSPRKAIKQSAQHLDYPVDLEALTAGTAWSWVQEAENCYLFYHSAFPLRPFRYPIPVRDQHIAHIPPVNARYLHGTTVRAFLRVGPNYLSTAARCATIDLVTAEDAWAGCLRLSSPYRKGRGSKAKVSKAKVSKSKVSNDKARKDETPIGDIVELVQISAGSVYTQAIDRQSFDEWERMKIPRRQESVYEFVNVLWVEWVDGVAYRKALGRVEKGVWERTEKETIELTLG